MNESNLNRMIREHKARIIWFLVFLILAVFVTALVFGTLKRSVQAQTYTKRVFACSYAQEGAEPVAHQHNDDCYENGELICTLPERELHIHGDECYAEEKVLVCTLEEGEGHIHSDACYTEEPVLACGQEEDLGHTHSDACYTEEQVLVCGLEENDGHVHSAENGCYTRVQGELICTNEDPEHAHNDDCYAWEEVLTCEIPEGEGAHHHDEQCYETQRILSCGQEEREPGHIHSDECYETQRVLSCGKEEGEGAHTHDDTCYEIKKVLICDKEEVKTEHVHTVDCFQVVDMSPEEIHALHMSELPESDPDADVESPDVWENRFASVPLSGHWDRDLLKIAETQLGYTESQRNFEAVPDEYGDGYTLKGWTRYGAWYGIPYGDWCAMFISFCLNYADIPESAIPYDCATTTWIDSLSARGMYAPAGSYDPKPGDLIFFDWEGDGLSDHVGIVWAVNPGSITTIEGNHTISVELFDYDLSDSHIQGYGILPENPALAVTESEENESGENKNPDEAEGGAASTSGASDNADPSNNNIDIEDTEKTELDPETLAKMPPFSYSERVAGMRVSIEADAGAFPEGTTVEIKAIEDDGLAEQVAPVVNGKVVQVQAVDITFYDAEGNEIEPLIPIRVTMRPNTETDEANGVEVVHVDNEGNVNAVTPDEGITQPDKGAAFDADSFSPYVLVYVLKFDYPVNGKTYESELAGGEDLLLSNLLVQLGVCEEEEVSEFVSKIDSVTASDPEALSVSEKDGVWTVRPMKESEGDLSLAIEMQDGAKFSVQVQATGKTEVSSEDNNTVITAVNDLYLPENAVTETAVLTEEESTDAIAAVEKAVEQEVPEAAAAPAAEAEGETPTVSQVAYQVFSISLDGVEYSKYEDGFQVSLTLPEGIAGRDFEVYHIDNDGNAQKLEIETDAHNLTEETQLVSTVSFVTPSFSDFVIRYTVDFHYKVNGNYYEFSFTGGSFVSLEKLLELLQIPHAPEPELEPVYAAEPATVEAESGDIGSTDIEIADAGLTSDPVGSDEPSESSTSSVASETEAKETRVVYNDLSGITVSDTTRDFVANISSVTFTNPDLIWVGKAEEETTVGALREANFLAPEYSAELTEEQIAEIDSQTVTAGDWALISLKPFQSEESLVITMNNGQVYKIRVTDDMEKYYVRLKFDSSDIPSFNNKPGSLYVLLKDTSKNVYSIIKIIDDMKPENVPNVIDVKIPSSSWVKADGSQPDSGQSISNSDNIEVRLVGVPDSTQIDLWGQLYNMEYFVDASSGEKKPKPSIFDNWPFSSYCVLNAGEFVNNYKVVSYPTSHQSDPNNSEVIYDIIELEKYQDTFNGYDLESILGYYNLVTLCEDYPEKQSPLYSGMYGLPSYRDGDLIVSNHTLGSVLVRGNFIVLQNDGTADSQFNSHSSVVGGKAINADGSDYYGEVITNRDRINVGEPIPDFIVGREYTIYGKIINGEIRTTNMSRNGRTISYQNYIDWDTLQSNMLLASSKLYSDSTEEIPCTWDWVEVPVQIGSNVTLQCNSDIHIKIKLIGDESSVNNDNGATIINVVGNSLVPQIWQINDTKYDTYLLKHNKTGNIEDGQGISILFNYPDATSLMLTSALSPSIGHVLAPKAAVYIQQCNYNGCIIGNSIAVHGAEGHLWPYTGHKGTIILTREEFDAVKTVNGETPASGQKYYFKLEEYKNGAWSLVERVQNDGKDISFTQIQYNTAGTFYYKVSEDLTSVSGGVSPDTTQYIAKVVVEETIGEHTVYTHTTEYYKVKENIADSVVTGADYGSLQTDKVDELGSSDMLSFNNQIEKKSITVEKKWFRGTDVTSTTTTPENIKFDLYRTKTIIDYDTPVDASKLQNLNGIKVNTDEVHYTISASEGWRLTIPDLEKYDADGREWYYYAIEYFVGGRPEDTQDTYSIDPNSGSIIIMNTIQQTTFGFNKIWLSATGSVDNPSSYQAWPTDQKIKITIGRRDDNQDDNHFKLEYEIADPISEGSTFTPNGVSGPNLTAHIVNNTYNFTLPSDSLEKLNPVTRNEWEYYVEENSIEPSEMYINPKYGTKNEDNNIVIAEGAENTTDNGYIVNQSFGGYELPKTGGPGTALYGLLGGLMAVTAGAVLTLHRKKNKA